MRVTVDCDGLDVLESIELDKEAVYLVVARGNYGFRYTLNWKEIIDILRKKATQ